MMANKWLMFALMTVASWGVYGVFLHMGAVKMGNPTNGRYKAFLWVGVAYLITAVVAPALLLMIKGATRSLRRPAWTNSPL